jgi:hypothetical protein
MGNAYKIFGQEIGGKRPLGRSRHRWEDNLVNLRVLLSEVVDWIHVTHDREQWRPLVNKGMNFRVP